jgi:hypothetical protein
VSGTVETGGSDLGPETLVVTTRQVMNQGWPVLLVSHDADDGRWQFVNGWGDTDDADDGTISHFRHLLEHDASLAGLHDLPLGWRAWRADEHDAWIREPHPRPGDRD